MDSEEEGMYDSEAGLSDLDEEERMALLEEQEDAIGDIEEMIAE